MCRSIRPLFNLDPPATEDEILAASRQFVRKISGFAKPSRANEAAISAAAEEIARISGQLLVTLVSTRPPKDRQEAAARAKARGVRRYREAVVDTVP